MYVDIGLISFTKGMQPIVAVSQGTADNCDSAKIDSVPLATSGETSVVKLCPQVLTKNKHKYTNAV